ncbi:hypothetical protein [Avibacterium paragallinarum]|nr:hypothetical protein [Avibacterium paragallinarum]
MPVFTGNEEETKVFWRKTERFWLDFSFVLTSGFFDHSWVLTFVMEV